MLDDPVPRTNRYFPDFRRHARAILATRRLRFEPFSDAGRLSARLASSRPASEKPAQLQTPYEDRQRMSAALGRVGVDDDQTEEVWRVIYSFGQALPDDMTI
jgi:hypothetical protein